MSRSRFLVPFSGLTAAVLSLPASAALDVSAATTYLSGDVSAALTAVGGAIILLAALAMGFKWIKAMFFG
jgi:hypothetical protein